MGKDEHGTPRIRLNSKVLFQVGPLDQGYWPDGVYTAPTDEALRFDIETIKKLGMNMSRKHVKVEPERWYYWCDRLGLLVWQDMPSAGNETPESHGQFEVELRRLIEGRRNHPAIIMWVVFNEGWGQHDTPYYARLVKRLDPSRLVNSVSGFQNGGERKDPKVGDVVDIHDYVGPGAYWPDPVRASVLGEFGGLGLVIPGHTWPGKGWGYRMSADRDALTREYDELIRRTASLRDRTALCAAIYTQISDVETECNGLMTYDREVIKVDVRKISAAHRALLANLPCWHTPDEWAAVVHAEKR